MKMKNMISIVTLGASLSFTLPALASGDNHNHGHESSSGGHMTDSKQMGQHMGDGMAGHMREVMGHGRLNKIMADRHMVNIKHEPMPEMKWPKMSMNFKTQKQVDLNSLKPGQEVEFKLLVDDDNNYVIKEIIVK